MAFTAVRVDPEVQAALDAGRPVVALESTIIAHGLPRPENLRVAREIEGRSEASALTVEAVQTVLEHELRARLMARSVRAEVSPSLHWPYEKPIISR